MTDEERQDERSGGGREPHGSRRYETVGFEVVIVGALAALLVLILLTFVVRPLST